MKLLLPTLILFLTFQAFAQETLPKKFHDFPGVKAYQQKRYQSAVFLLKKDIKQAKEKAPLWNLLGLSYDRLKNLKQASKAMKKAVSKDRASSVYRMNYAVILIKREKEKSAIKQVTEAIKLTPDASRPYLIRGIARFNRNDLDDSMRDFKNAIDRGTLQSTAYLSYARLISIGIGGGNDISSAAFYQRLRVAKATIEKCLRVCNDKSPALGKAFRDYNRFIELKDNKPDPKGCSSGLKILSKPLPGYTEKARRNGITGSIRMLVLFGKDSEIKAIVPLSALGGGLTEKAVEAANNIKFVPPICNGEPTDIVKTLVFNFKIY